MKPFRWDLHKPEQLGSLLQGERSPAYPEFKEDVRSCAAKVLARSQNGYLVFVGRSPESLFDYLSGVLQGSSKEHSFVQLNISNRYEHVTAIGAQRLTRLKAFQDHLEACALSPRQILARRGPTMFVDLVYEGGTFGVLASYLLTWAKQEHISLKEFQPKLHFLGLTWQTHTSPNTIRWQQHADWVSRLDIRTIENISIPGRFWDYLGNWQLKVSKTNRSTDWDQEQILEPPRQETHYKALRRAFDLYSLGQQERRSFTRILAKEAAVEYSWFRSLISELKGTAAS